MTGEHANCVPRANCWPCSLARLVDILANPSVFLAIHLCIPRSSHLFARPDAQTNCPPSLSCQTTNLSHPSLLPNLNLPGVFGLIGDTGELFDGQQAAGRYSSEQHRLAHLFAHWPMSVHFRLEPASSPISRQCNSLSDTVDLSAANRCQTISANSSSHVCRCDQLGFVALLASAAPNSQPPVPSNSLLADLHWNQLLGQQPSLPPSQPDELQVDFSGAPSGRGQFAGDPMGLTPTYMGVPGGSNYGKQQQQQQSMGFWTGAFIVVGLIMLVLSVGALVARAALQASAQSRLNKKHANFLSTSILAHHQRDLNGGPTTGPLSANEHGALIGAPTEPIIAAPSQSTSIIGLTQAACHAYKPHQQLYAAHLAPIEAPSRWGSVGAWLRPGRWLSFARANTKSDHIQHRVIGSTLVSSGRNTIGYKSQYQNGYTTNVHQSPASQVPLAAPSSSTSSYVSSSAYYEEIGPGNLTKVNTNQLARANHTIVDPFKRSPVEQQQQQQQQQLHHHHQQQQLLHLHQQQQLHLSQQHQHLGQQWSQAATTALTYAPVEGHQLSSNYGAHLASRHQQNDLNQLQSSSSSAGSQNSASTNLTTANSSTPRHYLFASPGAYKGSMSQHTLHHNLQQQQQQSQPVQQQQQLQQSFKQELQHRFM